MTISDFQTVVEMKHILVIVVFTKPTFAEQSKHVAVGRNFVISVLKF